MKRLFLCLWLLAEPLLAEPLLAATPQPLILSREPIEIEADRVELDEPKGESTYHGNVKVHQGDMHMFSDTLKVHVQDGKIERLTATGDPVKMSRDIEPPVKAQAQQLEYYAEQGLVVVQGQAHVWQGLNEFSGDHIEYLIEKELVSAVKGNTTDSRVRVILHPQQAPATPGKPGAEKPAEQNATPEVKKP